MDEQVRRGDDVAYFFSGRYFPVPGRPLLKRWRRNGVVMAEVINSPLYDHGRQPELELHEPRTERLFGRVLGELRPEVVHFHELAGLPFSLLDLARQAETPVVMTLADYFPLCSTFKLLDSEGQVCLRRQIGADCVATVAADPREPGLLHEVTAYFEFVKRPLLRRMSTERKKRLSRKVGARVEPPAPAGPEAYQRRRDSNVERLNRADCLIAMSERVADIYAQLGVESDRVRTVHLTLRRFERLKPRRRTSETVVRFATVAGLSSHAKGSRLLVDAIRLLAETAPPRSFKLLALGPVDPAVAADVETLEEIEVGATGPFSDDELDALLDPVDVGIVPSVWEEAYGFVGLEFLAKGIPVIANARGGMPDYTRDGETGWLNRSCSAPELAQIMREAIENRQQVADLNARILAQRESLIKPMPLHANEVEAIYHELMAPA